MTHSEEIRSRILNATAATKKATPVLLTPTLPPEPAKQNRWGLTVFLGICIIIMSVATFFVLNKKNGLQPPSSPPVGVQPAPVPVVPSGPGYASKADLDAMFAAMNARMDKADKRMDLWAHRTWLLAVANNENATIQQANDRQRFGVANSGYIVFDENWKLNKTPGSMQFDDKQKEDLQKDTTK